MDDFFGNQIPWNEVTAPDAATVATIREAIADNKRKEAERNQLRHVAQDGPNA